MRRGRLLVLILVLFLLVVLVGSVVGIVAMLDSPGGRRVADNAVLVLDISGPLPQQPLPEPPLSGLGPEALSMFEIDEALRRAAVDDRIARVLVRPRSLAAGFARVQELHDVLTQFSIDSGKPLTCWMEMAGNKEYLLATACDSIYMAPEGFLLVNGLHLGVTFFKGTLDKLGIEAEFTRAGKYKSAVEPMTSTEMSPAFREMLESMADSLFDQFVSTIAVSRNLSEQQVRNLIDDPPITAHAALRAGLVDGLYYRDQLVGHLGGYEVQSTEFEVGGLHLPGWSDVSELGASTPSARSVGGAGSGPLESIYGLALSEGEGEGESESRSETEGESEGESESRSETEGESESRSEGEGESRSESRSETEVDSEATEAPWFEAEDEIEWILLKEYRKSWKRAGAVRGPTVAIIFCEGQITSGSSDSGGFSGSSGSMGSDTIAAAIRSARENDRVRAIVLRVDSPGGSGLASDVIWREVHLARTRNDKPVVVSMGDYAASGGYYISMGADSIVAQPSTITGSIGVYAGKYNLSGLYSKLGLTTESVDRGALADIFAPERGLGDAGRLKIRAFVDGFYETFLRKAAQGRKTTPQAVHSVAQGRVWTGAQAKQLGLIDELGSLRAALAIAKELADIEGDVRLQLLPDRPSFLDEILGRGQPAGVLLPLLDRVALGPLGPNHRALRGAQHLLRAAPLLASGAPVLMAPYVLDVH